MHNNIVKVGMMDEKGEVKVSERRLKDNLPFLSIEAIGENVFVASGFDNTPYLLRINETSGYDIKKLQGHHKKQLTKRKSVIDQLQDQLAKKATVSAQEYAHKSVITVMVVVGEMLVTVDEKGYILYWDIK